MKRGLPILLGLLLLAYLATGIYQVEAGQQAVVRRFGRVLDEPRGPGLHIGLPWGLDRVDRVLVDERKVLEVGYPVEGTSQPEPVPVGQVLTGDQNLLNLRVRVYYRVHHERPEAVVQYVLNADRIEAILTRATEVSLTATLAGKRVDDVLQGKDKTLELDLREHLVKSITPYQLGVAIENVNVPHPQPPRELAEEFLKVNRARTQMETVQSEANEQAAIALREAQIEANKIRTDAEIASRNRIHDARARADKVLALLRTANPQNTLLDLTLNTLQEVIPAMQVRTLSDQPVNRIFFWPLPEK